MAEFGIGSVVEEAEFELERVYRILAGTNECPEEQRQWVVEFEMAQVAADRAR